MAIPFGGDPLGYGNTWLNFGSAKKVQGGTDVGKNVELGVQNDIGIDGKFFVNPATIVSVGNPSGGSTAVFAALNGAGETQTPGDTTAGVAVFGQSVAGDGITPKKKVLTNGIGVAGSCNTGCGVFGQSLFGSGVVGFATTAGAGWGFWGSDSTQGQRNLSQTFQNAGVLGQSDRGVGVRGHGGVLTGIVYNPPAAPTDGNVFLIDKSGNPELGAPPAGTAAIPSAPGGWFSSGLLATVQNNFIPEGLLISRSSQPQLRLVPSKPDNGMFPAIGTIGDFFLGINVDQEINLYLCLKINPETHKPVWSQVMLGPDADGGSFF